MPLKENPVVHFCPFTRGGEMGELMRSFDWSSTKPGNPETWPQKLKTTVNIVLTSKFPIFLWWGPELIQFYNDAYRSSPATTASIQKHFAGVAKNAGLKYRVCPGY